MHPLGGRSTASHQSVDCLVPPASTKRPYLNPEMAKNTDGQKDKLVSSETQKVHRPISAKELGLHNRHDDCWLAIHDNVYDVTKWAPQHPGGDIIVISEYGRSGIS